MNSWFGRYNIRSNPYSNYDSAPCMNKYHKIKNDIENKIDVFNKISGTNVHKQWDILNRLIMTKDQELKECYEKRYVKVKLNDEEKIKNFKRTCNRNRTCDNQATPAKKTTITKAPEQRNCKDRDSCKNETPARVDVKSQSKLSSAVGNPQRSEIKNPQEQGQNQADVQKLRQESVIPQFQSGSMPSVSSVGTNDKTSQEVVDHHSTTSGMVEPQKQQLDATVHSGNSELGSPLTDNSSQCISGETSDLICPSKEKNLDTRDIKSIQHSGNALDNNHSGSQDSFSKILAGGTGVDKDIIRETPLNLSPTESTSDSVQLAGEDPLPTANDSGSTGSLASDNKNTVSEEISSASLAGAPSSDADTNGITAVDISTNHRAPGGEINSVKDNHGHSLVQKKVMN
ncbi:hypothetical protein PVIIG_05340 [Plasmodium vivax India VII]|uniref:Variable surface protein Vir18 n=1 Tax=Plasmodium vivax India VII TaxID=1077284 RepID=A0A0J9S2Z8_PLAVI|nr:hypothetical protein PVIIG_05340 [Plasmodium vivax India VII]